MLVDYSLYLVTDRSLLTNLDLLPAVDQAVKGGVTLVQLREKNVSSRDFYHLALKMKEMLSHSGVPLIINDRLDIALAIEADGLHIGQEDLPLPVARRLLGRDKILGYSVANVEQARYGENNGADYLGAGSVYPTGSKEDAGHPIGLEMLRNIKLSVHIPVVGIGGISRERLHEVKAAGIDGISVISAVLGGPDIEARAQWLRNRWREI